MNSAEFLDDIIPDVTAPASVQIINMGHIGPLEADWITII